MTIPIHDAARPTRAFLALPARVYAGDPRWIPEEPEGVLASFDAATNPWLARGAARTFAVDGEARAAAFVDPGLRIGGEPAGFFGLFETRGDPGATAAVLRAVEAWLAGAGCRVALGPVSFSTALSYRVALDPGGHAPFPGEPYNPPWYAARLEDAGYRVARRYVTQAATPAQAAALARAGDRAREALAAAGFRLERLVPDLWRERLPELHAVVEEAFADGFAYAPMGLAFFRAALGEPVARRLCPRTSAVLLDPGGAIAAFALVFPDYGPLAAQGAGAARVPASGLAYDRCFPALERLGTPRGVLKTVAVRPAHRGRGAARALLASMPPGAYGEWLGALIREDNPSRRIAPPGFRERAYALLSRRLGAGGAP